MSLNAPSLLQRLTTRLKLRHMQALVALADLRGMGRAARAMGISQPAMSQLVGELERLLETQLFLRHSKGTDPTEAALDLLPVARRIVGAAEEAAERVAMRNRHDSGLVRVASTTGGLGALLHAVLPRFAEDYPHVQVQVSLVIGPSRDAAFVSDEYDIVCSSARAVVPEGWTFQPCMADALVVVCGARHPLARRTTVTRKELGRAAWLRNHIATDARQRFDELAAREGWDGLREVQVQSRVTELVWSMLQAGTLLTLVPRSAFVPWLDEGLLKVLPTGLDLPLPDVGCYWKPAQARSATWQLVERLIRAGA